MPTFRAPAANPAKAQRAMRGLSHATRTINDPQEIYAVLTQPWTPGRPSADPDLNTLATALYVTAGDLLKAHPGQVPWRPAASIQTRVTDAQIITLAVVKAERLPN